MTVLVDPSAGPAVPYGSTPRPCIPQINPSTGLSTDYLNHFTEAFMILGALRTMPECAEDLKAWRAKTYCEHFANSYFADRDTVIAAYWAAPAEVREELERISETLNSVLSSTRDVMIQCSDAPNADELAQRALDWLKPLIDRMAAVINGTARGRVPDHVSTQAAVDALFNR